QAELIEKKFREELNSQRHGVIRIDPKVTLGQLAAHFIAEVGCTANHEGRLRVLLPFWSEIPVLSINKGHAQEFRVWRHKQKDISEATVNRDLSMLRHIL